jgi:protein TIF31
VPLSPPIMTETTNTSQDSAIPPLVAKETARSMQSGGHSTDSIKDSQKSNKPQSNEEETFELVAFTIYIVTPKKQKLSLQVSALDSVQEIKNFLEQSPESLFVTSYHLELEGKPINEYVQLSEIPELKEGSVLHMVEDPYNERTARLHVQALQERLVTAAEPPTAESPSLFHDISTEKAAPDKLCLKTDEKTGESEVLLTAFFPKSSQQNIRCLRRLGYSGWNPPPPQRQMMGDLLYLDVVTLEEQSFCITAWTKGFFINNTHDNVFDPSPGPSPCHSHTLADLLAKVSPLFGKSIQAIFTQISEKHPFETAPVPIPCYSWLGKPPTSHEYSNSRAELNLLRRLQSDFLIQGQFRDWNEEWQVCRELPRETIQERIIRDRAMYKVHCDFVEAAIDGAMAVISGSVPPLNPLDAPLDRLFIYNSIFFCFAYNGVMLKGSLDKNLYRQVNNELIGITMLNSLDIPELHTTLFAIVDYRGYRVVAQSLIPGLFAGIESQKFDFVRYGSPDGKKRVHDEEFYQLFKGATNRLYLKEHTVLDSEGNKYKIAGSHDQKGIRGPDGRWYVLESVRLTPRDANYLGEENVICLLRPELITQYIASQILHAIDKKHQTLQQKQTSDTKIGDQNSADKSQQKSTIEREDSVSYKENNNKIKEQTASIPLQREETLDIISDVSFNADVFTGCKFGDPEEKVKADEVNVQKLAAFLKNEVIKTVVEDFENRASVPSDSETLTTVLHLRGINLRYLGYIASLCAQNNKALFAYNLCLREMICRATKKILNERLMKTETQNLASTIATFLNVFFGKFTPRNMGSRSGFHEYQKQMSSGLASSSSNMETSSTSPQLQSQTTSSSQAQSHSQIRNFKYSKGKKKVAHYQQQLQQKEENEIPSMNHNTLWAQIRKIVKEHYNFELPEEIPAFIFDMVTLRSLCQKCGIKIVCRNYNLESDTPFTSADILGLFPNVKYADLRTVEGHQLLEIGKNYIAQSRYDVAYEFLIEALAIFHQVYGPLSKEAAQCYRYLR